MNAYLFFVSIVLFFALNSCEKNNETSPPTPHNSDTIAGDTIEVIDTAVYDTIFPLDYFPAYPGSLWVYDNNRTLRVSNQYEKYVFNAAFYNASPDYDTFYFPKLILNGFFNSPDSFAYVNEFSISKELAGTPGDPAFKKLLSYTEGSQFIIKGVHQGQRIKGKTIEDETSVFIGTKKFENVIVIIQFDEACVLSGGTPETCATIKEYYAKNVGLIKRDKKVDGEGFVKEIELVSYTIKK